MTVLTEYNPKITIIIPCYKVEGYLPECLDSVINQTFNDWQAICVDDGSPDNCGKILDEYANKDRRIKVIHQENKGLSGARNAAYPYIDTPYTMFLDSDDLLHHQTLELAYNKIEEALGDVLWFDIEEFNDGKKIEQKVISKNNEVKIYHNPFRFYVAKDQLFTTRRKRMPGVVWNKLYKSEFVKTTPNALGISPGEDMLFTIEIVSKVSNLVHLREKLYFYRQRESSIMGSLNYEKIKTNMRKEINWLQKIKNDLNETNAGDEKIAIFDKYLADRVFFKKILRPFLRGQKDSQSKEYIDKLIKSGLFNFKIMKLKFRFVLFLYQHNQLKLSKMFSSI